MAYGVFMKGASAQGRIERNLIICTTQDISQPGNRIGLSFGGGGTDSHSHHRSPSVVESPLDAGNEASPGGNPTIIGRSLPV